MFSSALLRTITTLALSVGPALPACPADSAPSLIPVRLTEKLTRAGETQRVALRLFTTLQGFDAIWEQIVVVTPDDRGVFTVYLGGARNPFPSANCDGYLLVSPALEPDLPRRRFLTPPRGPFDEINPTHTNAQHAASAWQALYGETRIERRALAGFDEIPLFLSARNYPTASLLGELAVQLGAVTLAGAREPVTPLIALRISLAGRRRRVLLSNDDGSFDLTTPEAAVPVVLDRAAARRHFRELYEEPTISDGILARFAVSGGIVVARSTKRSRTLPFIGLSFELASFASALMGVSVTSPTAYARTMGLTLDW